MNFYERHIGDYLKDTAHLSLLEHGVYGRILDVYYTRESALPDSQIARLIGAKSKDEIAAMRAVLAEFFVQDEKGDWTQARCEREICRYQEKQRKASASAKARWSQSERNANASPNAMRTHSEGNAPTHQSPVPTTQSPETHTKAGSACLAMRRAGVQDVNPGHPDLLALLDAGATEAEFSGAAATAVERGKGFAYAIGMLKRQREDAAKSAAKFHRGSMPQDRKSRQLEGAALLTGAKKEPETIDVDSRVIAS